MWNLPLQSGGMRQTPVHVPPAMPFLCVAKMEAVCCENVLHRREISSAEIYKLWISAHLSISKWHFIPPTCVLRLVHQPKNVQYLRPSFHLDKRLRWKIYQTTCEERKDNVFHGNMPLKVEYLLRVSCGFSDYLSRHFPCNRDLA